MIPNLLLDLPSRGTLIVKEALRKCPSGNPAVRTNAEYGNFWFKNVVVH